MQGLQTIRFVHNKIILIQVHQIGLLLVCCSNPVICHPKGKWCNLGNMPHIGLKSHEAHRTNRTGNACYDPSPGLKATIYWTSMLNIVSWCMGCRASDLKLSTLLEVSFCLLAWQNMHLLDVQYRQRHGQCHTDYLANSASLCAVRIWM